MIPDRTSYLDHLERTCCRYRESIAKGDDWARIPCEITERFLSLLQRSDVSASDAAELVRLCDQHQITKGGIVFWMMCNAIREWYRDIYERELRDTL